MVYSLTLAQVVATDQLGIILLLSCRSQGETTLCETTVKNVVTVKYRDPKITSTSPSHSSLRVEFGGHSCGPSLRARGFLCRPLGALYG